MQKGGFGRKGLGNTAPSTRGGASPPTLPAGPTGHDDAMAQAREAFIAQERARRSAETASYREGTYHAAFGPARQSRSLALAYVLWLVLGNISVHRFYLGATQSAIVQIGVAFFGFALILAGAPLAYLGIFLIVIWLGWLLLDLFLMPGVHRKFCVQGSSYLDIREVYS